jgi:hypothetical protein
MHSAAEVELVLSLIASGHSDVEVKRRTGIPRSTVRDWRTGRVPGRRAIGSMARPCPICQPGSEPLAESDYAYLLGLYLGDGCVSENPRTYCLRIFLDAAYPGIVAACRRALEAVRPENRAWVGRSKKSRCNVVMMYSNHWPCLLPQMGAGRKHDRRIRLAQWQEDVVSREREALLRGLIHSDGCRVVANDRGVESVRYHFSNKSEDIKRIYCESLDALDVRWTRPCAKQIAVYRKASTARLDEFIGPKR